MAQHDQLTITCDECGSPFFAHASTMPGLCPECAHHLYGYPNCHHTWVDDHCTKCGWNGSRSDHVRELIRKAEVSAQSQDRNPLTKAAEHPNTTSKADDNLVAQYLTQFRNLGLDGGPATHGEIAELERWAGVLPASYQAYLLIAGRAPPGAWVGSDCTLRHLPGLRQGAEALLKENGQAPLPPSAFVFLMHQGYQFFYFNADGKSDDPPVFYYLEGESAVVQRFERFSDLVSVVADDNGG